VRLLLLSTGGGGGNILRSVKALFDRDLAVTEKADSRYARRLRDAVTTRFLDTNEFSLTDVPPEERVLIGARTTGRLGARHNPDVARQALEESQREVEALLKQHAIVILIGTGGKGTGAGTMFPLAQLARQHRKLVLPIFVRPSFERHEVDKRRYDHALNVIERFDAAKIRLMEILNDRGYTESSPQPQSVVWERMNLPIARGLRGLIYVLWELSQVDPSDLSMLFAGHGRLRIGFADIDSPAGQEPSDAEVERAARCCWDNPYYAFSKPPGTSLICIQGEWSNVVDARIKGHLATLALGGKAETAYTPLYARAVCSPRPWGVTMLLAEYTGAHQPLEIDWSFASEPVSVAVRLSNGGQRLRVDGPALTTSKPAPEFRVLMETATAAPAVAAARGDSNAGTPFSSLWEFAMAVNRSNPIALAMASGDLSCEIPIDGADVRKLLQMMWFRGVVTRLSPEWRTRLFDALRTSLEIPNHFVKVGRRHVRLSDLGYAGLREALTSASLPDAIRAEVELLVTIGRVWGEDAVRQCHFREMPEPPGVSGFASLLQGLRPKLSRMG
jgi:cell division GTPase FtsZ